MVEPLRHRQTKGAATDMFDLKPLRHISTLPLGAQVPTKNRSPIPSRLLTGVQCCERYRLRCNIWSDGMRKSLVKQRIRELRASRRPAS